MGPPCPCGPRAVTAVCRGWFGWAVLQGEWDSCTGEENQSSLLFEKLKTNGNFACRVSGWKQRERGSRAIRPSEETETTGFKTQLGAGWFEEVQETIKTISLFSSLVSIKRGVDLCYLIEFFSLSMSP